MKNTNRDLCKAINVFSVIGLVVVIGIIICVVKPDLYVRTIDYLYHRVMYDDGSDKMTTETMNAETANQGCLEVDDTYKEGQNVTLPGKRISAAQEKHCAKVLKRKRWDRLSKKKKTEVLAQILKNETGNLGVTRKVKFKIKKLNKDVSSNYFTYGVYDAGKDTIFLDPLALEDAYEGALDTLAHEVFHLYQRQVCSIYDHVANKNRSLYFFKEIGLYDLAKNGYKEAEKNGLKQYRNQMYEKAARKYAKERVRYYKKLA